MVTLGRLASRAVWGWYLTVRMPFREAWWSLRRLVHRLLPERDPFGD